MSRINQPKPAVHTHEGARASRVGAEEELRRTVMACLLWEGTFYESGHDIAQRIMSLVPLVKPHVVRDLAIEAREVMKLRHVPLLLAREMCRYRWDLAEETVERVIQRPDEMAEILAIYSRDRTGPKKLNKLSKPLQRGLARAFCKFSPYQLAKYNRKGEITLRDVLFLCHAKPQSLEQTQTWKKLIAGELEAPDTWEVALSGGADKLAAWSRLLAERKLGALALIRNLRNMLEVGVPQVAIEKALADMDIGRVLPFRFIAAARYAPRLEPSLEAAMYKGCEGLDKLPGTTALLLDHSDSMNKPLSAKSEMTRWEAACGLAILAREQCESVRIFAFSDWFEEIAPRRGFALRDVLTNAGHFSSTYLGAAIKAVGKAGEFDRVIVLTDEQSHDPVGPPPKTAKGAYMVNVATYKHGVAYGPWTHISGWSEGVLRYIGAVEG